MKIPPLPQKKSAFQENAPVIKAMQQEGVPPKGADREKAKENLRRIILQVKIDPQRIIQAGQYAQAALKDKKMYPIAIQIALKENLISQNDIKHPNGIDYPLLAKGIMAGKLTAELIKEGKV